MGEVRLDGENWGRLGFWTPPTDKNRAVRKAAAKTPFQRRRDVGTIAMNLKVIWKILVDSVNANRSAARACHWPKRTQWLAPLHFLSELPGSFEDFLIQGSLRVGQVLIDWYLNDAVVCVTPKFGQFSRSQKIRYLRT